MHIVTASRAIEGEKTTLCTIKPLDDYMDVKMEGIVQ